MPSFDWQPTLTAAAVRLRPLQADDFDALYTAAADPLIWEQHPDPNRYQRTVFEERFFRGAMASGGAFAVISNAGEIVGSSRYYDVCPKTRAVAIGYTFLRRDQWGTGVNSQMKQLMLAHAFRWARVVWFHVGESNFRSRRAVEKLGAHIADNVLMDVNGVPTPYLHYRIDAPD